MATHRDELNRFETLAEGTIRKRLARQGFYLRKRRSRIMKEAEGDGYMIVDADNIVVGGGYGADGFTMSLPDCAAWAPDCNTPRQDHYRARAACRK